MKANVSKQECATRDGGGRHALAFFPTIYPFGSNYVVYLSLFLAFLGYILHINHMFEHPF